MYDSYAAFVAAKRAHNERVLLGIVEEVELVKQELKPIKKKIIKKQPRAKAPRRRSKRLSDSKLSDSKLSDPKVEESTLPKKVVVEVDQEPVKSEPWNPRVTFVGNKPEGLTEEQQKKLKNAMSWLPDFEKFLQQVPHGRNNRVCSGANVRSVIRSCMLLSSGAGVTYRHWKKGISFCQGQVVDLKSDLGFLHEKSLNFEQQHGKDRSNGWLMSHPLHKLHLYQQYRCGNDYHF